MSVRSYAIGYLGTEYIANEFPIGDIDGINTVFTLNNEPVENTVIVSLSGILQAPGINKDYNISGKVITFYKAPKAGQEVIVSYFSA